MLIKKKKIQKKFYSIFGKYLKIDMKTKCSYSKLNDILCCHENIIYIM